MHFINAAQDDDDDDHNNAVRNDVELQGSSSWGAQSPRQIGSQFDVCLISVLLPLN